MSIFALKRKPRHFHHIPIFYDENKRKEEPQPYEELHGAFTKDNKHLQRRRNKHAGWSTNARILLILILVLALAWYLLIR